MGTPFACSIRRALSMPEREPSTWASKSSRYGIVVLVIRVSRSVPEPSLWMALVAPLARTRPFRPTVTSPPPLRCTAAAPPAPPHTSPST